MVTLEVLETAAFWWQHTNEAWTLHIELQDATHTRIDSPSFTITLLYMDNTLQNK